MVTKKDFIEIARVLHELRPATKVDKNYDKEYLTWANCVFNLGDLFETLNPLFSKSKFENAAFFGKDAIIGKEYVKFEDKKDNEEMIIVKPKRKSVLGSYANYMEAKNACQDYANEHGSSMLLRKVDEFGKEKFIVSFASIIDSSVAGEVVNPE